MDEPTSSQPLKSSFHPDDGFVSDPHHNLPQNTNQIEAISLITEEEKKKEDLEGEEYDDARSTGSGTKGEDWDFVSPLLLSSSTSRVLRSKLRYNDSTDDDGDTEQVSPQFRGGILPGFVSPLEAFYTVAAGFMALSSASLVIGSFYFSWSDTTLRVHIDTYLASGESDISSPLQFDLPLYKNATFQSTLSIFQSSHSYMIVVLVIASTLFMPSIWIMLCPNLVVGMHRFSKSKYRSTNDNNHYATSGWFSFSQLLRWWFDLAWTHERIGSLLTIAEIFIKFSLSIMYVQSILLVCTSGINFTLGSSMPNMTDEINNEWQAIEGNDGEYEIFAQVTNNTRGGSISYLMGISFGVAAAALVRFHWRRHEHSMKCAVLETSENDKHDLRMEIQSAEKPACTEDRSNGIPSPPTSAFRLLSENYDENQDSFQQDDSLTYPLIESANTEQPTGVAIFNEKMIKWKFPLVSTILLVETGILSTILLFPTFMLPLIRLDYVGMAVPLITDTKNSLTLWDILDSVSINSGHGILSFIAKIMFWFNIIIAPLVSLIMCLSIWFIEYWKGLKPLKVCGMLQFVHPSANSTPFAISMSATVASLNLISDFLFNKYNICEILAQALHLDSDEEKCLVISGTLLPGFWFLLFQGICLDLFVRATLAAR